jgi:hypothetical protein
MTQFSLPHPLAAKFLAHVESIRLGRNPDEVVYQCLIEGIDIIQSGKTPVNRLKAIDARENGSIQKKISYKEIAPIGPVFNNMKIAFDLASRRQLVREAIVAYCIKQKICDEAGHPLSDLRSVTR